MLRSAIEGIKKRGGADIGDKTLLDALAPMTDTIERAIGRGDSAEQTVAEAATAARVAANETSVMQARRGRASYSGERSIGSPDAGAVAVAVIVERIAAGWSSKHA
jgi:dihydroxyacetone kinase